MLDLLVAAGVPGEEAPDKVSVFEAQTLDEQDAERWALELADRLVENFVSQDPEKQEDAV